MYHLPVYSKPRLFRGFLTQIHSFTSKTIYNAISSQSNTTHSESLENIKNSYL